MFADSTKSILLVEACSEIRQVLKMILETRGYHVAVAGSIADAESQIAIASPDSVLLDASMPGEALVAFVASIQIQHPQIALVLMGFGAELPARAAKLGIERTLRKPFDFLMMLDIVAGSCLVEDASVKELTA